jgi:hypothetical protein
VSENKIIRKIFRPKKNEVREQFGIFQNEKLCDLNHPPLDVVRVVKCMRVRWTRCVLKVGDKKNAYRILWGSLFKGIYLEDREKKWEGNFNIYLRETSYGGGRWMEMAQGCTQRRVLILTVLNFRVLLL